MGCGTARLNGKANDKGERPRPRTARIQNGESRIQSPEYRVQRQRTARIQSEESRVQGPESRVQRPATTRIQNRSPEFRIKSRNIVRRAKHVAHSGFSIGSRSHNLDSIFWILDSGLSIVFDLNTRTLCILNSVFSDSLFSNSAF